MDIVDLPLPRNQAAEEREAEAAFAASSGSAARTWKRVHLRLCVRGAIRNQSFDGLQHNDGRPMTRDEAFHALCDCLKAGKEYVPVGECDNWDDEKEQCLGHPSPPNDQADR